MKIVIEGNIGCGKSSLLAKLSTPWLILPEPVERWKTYLNLFYHNPSKFALGFNLHILTYFNQLVNLKHVIFERSPYSCRYVFSQQQLEDGHLHPVELETLHTFFENLSWKPDVIIYLRTDPHICYERMKKRDRECEKEVPLDYLVNIHNQHEKYIKQMKSSTTVFEIDGSHSQEEVLRQVQEIINRFHNRV
jgi:thymidine kinase